jgi:hypothetical protein
MVTFSLAVSSTTGGTVSPSGTHTVNAATPIGITANANSGHRFVNWTVISGTAVFGNANSENTTVTLSGNATIRANFEIIPIDVTFTALTANGSSTQTTTQLTLTFSQAITGLTANDITLSGVSGVNNITKNLSGSGITYTLTISNVTAGGTLGVSVTKTGYNISNSPRTVNIFFHASLAFTLINNSTAYSVSRGSVTESSIVIPSTHNGLPVTAIAMSGFSNYTNLTSITIPNSITQIGSRAFENCISLTSVTIPSSVTWVGEWAFLRCTSLTSVTLNNTVIGMGQFSGCNQLSNITIPTGVISIPSGAFQNCTSLTSLIIPNSVTAIGWDSFEGCTGLTV